MPRSATRAPRENRPAAARSSTSTGHRGWSAPWAPARKSAPAREFRRRQRCSRRSACRPDGHASSLAGSTCRQHCCDNICRDRRPTPRRRWTRQSASPPRGDDGRISHPACADRLCRRFQANPIEPRRHGRRPDCHRPRDDSPARPGPCRHARRHSPHHLSQESSGFPSCWRSH